MYRRRSWASRLRTAAASSGHLSAAAKCVRPSRPPDLGVCAGLGGCVRPEDGGRLDEGVSGGRARLACARFGVASDVRLAALRYCGDLQYAACSNTRCIGLVKARAGDPVGIGRDTGICVGFCDARLVLGTQSSRRRRVGDLPSHDGARIGRPGPLIALSRTTRQSPRETKSRGARGASTKVTYIARTILGTFYYYCMMFRTALKHNQHYIRVGYGSNTSDVTVCTSYLEGRWCALYLHDCSDFVVDLVSLRSRSPSTEL